MAKNILIFSDGTGQAGGVRPDQRLSNVYKLYRASRTGPDSPVNPAEQVSFYDAGLGTDDDVGPALLGTLKFFQKLLAAATGRGITRNIIDCYEAILNAYEPGDRIFLIGFSRGAYTARCVAGVLSLCGVPTKGADGQPLSYHRSETRAIAAEAVRKVYEHGAGKPTAEHEADRAELARRFRERYGSDLDGHANVDPYFIGVFDTVASLGAKGVLRFLIWAFLIGLSLGLCYLGGVLLEALSGTPVRTGFLIFTGLGIALFAISSFRSTFKYIKGFPGKRNFRWHLAKWKMKNYDQGLSPRVRFARHAIAIDETRADFPRVKWGFRQTHKEEVAGEPEWFQQIWFAGNHSDIGGSYPEEESRLSDIALGWMIEQATSVPHPLLVDSSRLNLFPDSGGMQHCEVESRRDSYPGWLPEFCRITWPEKPRKEALNAPMHPTVLERFSRPAVRKWGRLSPYRPSTLREDGRFAHFYDDLPTGA